MGTHDIREKVDFAESLVCAWAGVDKGILVLNLRSDMTGHVIGEWRVNRLTVPRQCQAPSMQKAPRKDQDFRAT
jgi:hypothetical protein